MLICNLKKTSVKETRVVLGSVEPTLIGYNGSSKVVTCIGLVTFIIVTMPFHNTQYIMGYNIMAQPHGLTMSL